MHDGGTEAKLRDYLKRVSAELTQTKRKLKEAESSAPIAIVGMACRLPGDIHSPEELWHVVDAGIDTVSPFPRNRGWDLSAADPGFSHEAAMLHEVADFDNGFFNITPREAVGMDPQQRLVLETTWEAIERARIDARSLTGRQVGVFTGAIDCGYFKRLDETPEIVKGYEITGTHASMISGRVSYVLGLHGPAISIDTACSSSLTAVHLAIRSLRAGECELALTSGVAVMPSIDGFEDFSRQGGLAPNGRIKPFSAAADGTNWSEGVGTLVLQPLSQAIQQGRPVLAVLRGSAINQDGASNGITAPNDRAQERVIRAALADSGLDAADIDVVEAHGTGTPLGDPLEAKALLATYGKEHRKDRPLRLGSIKSNLGHSGPAAGITGIIKTVEALRHETMPRTIHVDAPTPNVDWESGAVELLTEPAWWPATDRPRRAAVSGFGISGTNAHVVIEEAPEIAESPAKTEPATGMLTPITPWVISGKNAKALKAQAERLLAYVTDTDMSLKDVAYSLATTRAHFDERAVVVGDDLASLQDGLQAIAAGDDDRAQVAHGQVREGKLAFLFTGQGSQRLGMGRELYETSPVFARALDDVCAHLDQHLSRPLRDVVFGDDPDLLHQTGYTQPALFAIEVALFRLYEAWGVTPDYLNGHSIGELSAAHAAGVLSLPDACALVAARGRLMQNLPEGGSMVAIQGTEEEIRPLLNERVDIATINGPRSVVVSGDADAVEPIVTDFTARGRKTKRLVVSHAFHSPRMDDMLEDFRAVAAGLTYQAPQIPIVSNLTGALAAESELRDPDFWVRHVRQAVRFAEGVSALSAAGVTTFIELGPDGVLTGAAQDCVADEAAGFMATLRANRGESLTLTLALAHAHARGVSIDWGAYFDGSGAGAIDLPTYAFQHQRFWLDSASRAGDVSAAGLDSAGHGLLGASIHLAESDRWVFTGLAGWDLQDWIPDHAIQGRALLPGTAFIDMALHVGQQVGFPRVAELTLQKPFVISESEVARIQVVVGEADEDARSITIYSRSDDAEEWTCHALGSLGAAAASHAAIDSAWPPPGAEPMDTGDFYERLVPLGYRYGPAFQCMSAAWRRGDEIFCEVSLPHSRSDETTQYGVHPALLDASLHGNLLDLVEGDMDAVNIPFTWSGVELFSTGATSLRVSARSSQDGPTLVNVFDQFGHPVAIIESLVVRELPQINDPVHDYAENVITLDWSAIENDSTVDWLRLDSADPAALSTVPDPAPEVVVVPRNPTAAPTDAVLSALAMLRQWLGDERFVRSRLVFTLQEQSGADAAVAGAIRAAAQEHPERFGVIYSDSDDIDLEPAVGALSAGDIEVRQMNAVTTVPRLRARGKRRTLAPPQDAPWRVGVAEGGQFDVIAAEPEPLAAGEVRISVKAAGLNFRDLVVALNMVEGFDARVGLEGAGVVTEVAPDVTTLQVGDRVMGLLRDALAPESVGLAQDLVPMPPGWTFAQGASIPLAFLTTWVSLSKVAAIKPGERVLVHSATGGVGLAAIQVARMLGAEVFATASAPKQHHLRSLGLDNAHIASTRTLDFREHFFATTGGAGVDVVLNTLAGEFTDASLDLLSSGGRMIELGKTDVREPAAVAAEHPGVRYQYFDLGDYGHAVPGAWRELMALFASGDFQVPQMKTWPIERAPEAIELMQRAEHVGKIVFTFPEGWSADKTVLITGGTGTLAGLLARHLVRERGVRHLLLTSRRGPEAPGAGELVAELEAEGARVTVAACDVSDRSAVSRLLSDVPAANPLGSVIHTAGIVEDGIAQELTADQVRRVWRAKAESASHLDVLTRDLPLEHFILFSSAAGTVGSPGQANYAAANAYLDHLARERRREGFPGTSLAWGMWEESSGMTSHLGRQDVARVSRSGVRPIRSDEGLALFDAAVSTDEPTAVTVFLDQKALRDQSDSGALPAIMRDLVEPARSTLPRARPSVSSDAATPLPQNLASIPVEERANVILALVRSQAASVLLLDSPEDLDPHQAFREVGVDSLTAVELRNRLNKVTRLQLPASMVLDHPTPAALAEAIVAELPEPDKRQPEPEAVAPAPARENDGNSMAALMQSAVIDGKAEDVRRLCTGMAALRPSFGATDNVALPAATTLVEGDDEAPIVVCLPSFIGRPSPFHYSELAQDFPRNWTVVSLALPGFRQEEPIATDVDALLSALTREIRAHTDRRMILLGHSGGGLLAGALAFRLEQAGHTVEAVVALDPPRWEPHKPLPSWFSPICAVLSDLERRLGLADDDEGWLTAGAWYGRFDFAVPDLDAPTLLLRAERLLDGFAEETNGWKIVWDLDHDDMATPGDHFTMLQGDNAASCAETIVNWLGKRVK